jgi:hypothetical protein
LSSTVEQQNAADIDEDGNVLSGYTSIMRACGTQWTEGPTSHETFPVKSSSKSIILIKFL